MGESPVRGPLDWDRVNGRLDFRQQRIVFYVEHGNRPPPHLMLHVLWQLREPRSLLSDERFHLLIRCLEVYTSTKLPTF